MNVPRWLIPLVAVGVVLLIIVLPLVGTYNSLVQKDAAVDKAFADLDVQLQRRYDLVPNLVAAVKGALNQEQAVFGEIARARQNYAGARSNDDKVAAANQLEGAISRLLVIVENYPQLKSNQNIQDLMVQLEGTENRISQARRDYNAVVTEYNVSIRRFPRNLIAGMFGFNKRPLFVAQPAAAQAPQVDLGNTPTTAAPAGPSTTLAR
jgi:LemA protein